MTLCTSFYGLISAKVDLEAQGRDSTFTFSKDHFRGQNPKKTIKVVQILAESVRNIFNFECVLNIQLDVSLLPVILANSCKEIPN